MIMKRVLILLSFITMLALPRADAQLIQVFSSQQDVEDSTVVTWVNGKYDLAKWDSVYVEAIWTGLAAGDTTSQIEVYSSLGGDFTDATDELSLTAADGSGGTGTIVKAQWLNTSTWGGQVRWVIDPAASVSSTAKLKLYIKPYYHVGFVPK